MADSFFGFDTSINFDDKNGIDLLDDANDFDEQEYDALNDETFGNDEDGDVSLNDDWEAQHEQLAEAIENTKFGNHLETSSSSLKNGTIDYNDQKAFTILPTVNQQKTEHNSNAVPKPSLANNTADNHISLLNGFTLPKKFSTLEEIERNILASSNQGQDKSDHKQILTNNFTNQTPPSSQAYPQHAVLPPAAVFHQHPSIMPPPGFLGAPHHHMPQQPPLVIPSNNNVSAAPSGLLVPPGMLGPNQLMNQLLMTHKGVNPPQILRTPGVLPIPIGVDLQAKVPLHGNFSVPPPNFNQLNIDIHRPPPNFPTPNQQKQMNGQSSSQSDKHQTQQSRHREQQQRVNGNARRDYYNNFDDSGDNGRRQSSRDEYDGLMTTREKNWVINIQMSQINTGTPYFDDYYYTVYKEKKAEKENSRPINQNQRTRTTSVTSNSSVKRDNRGNCNRNGNQGQQNQVNCKIYAPTQFENSLGKLQCGSITAPRKIIDMELVGHDNEANVMLTNVQRDKRVKLTLIELESIYSLVLRLEDVDNPVAIMNLLKLREIREKQKILELETATSEEKEVILKQLQDSSLVRVDNKFDLISKIIGALFNEEKFNNYMAIRKGKTVVLRFLPHLYNNIESLDKLIELWIKILSSIPAIGKRDQLSDVILPKFYPLFKRFLELINMNVLVNISIQLIDNKKIENTRMTPISKCVLYYILSNKLGVSCIVTMIERCEFFYLASLVSKKQENEWINFIMNVFETITMTNVKIDTPLEFISRATLDRHLKRFQMNLVNVHDSNQKFYDVFCSKDK